MFSYEWRLQFFAASTPAANNACDPLAAVDERVAVGFCEGGSRSLTISGSHSPGDFVVAAT
jgi:hypothetical protein